MGQPMNRPTWRATAIRVAWMYLFVVYFSLVFQLMVFGLGVSSLASAKYSLVFAIPWLIVPIVSPKSTKVWFGFVGVVMLVSSSVKITYLLIYHQELSQSVFFTIFESNVTEGLEYAGDYFSWVMVPVLTFFTLGAWLIYQKIQPVNIGVTGKRTLFFLVTLIFIEPVFSQWQGWNTNTVTKVRDRLVTRISSTTPWQLVTSYVKYQNQLATVNDFIERWKSSDQFSEVQLMDDHEDQTFVLVIGESTNRERMSLYGYPRKTTPELDGMAESLVVFTDVIATRPYTIESLTHALSFATVADPDAVNRYPNLLSLMNAAGFHTTWITNQQTVSERNTMLTALSMVADERVYLNNNRRQNSSLLDDAVMEPYHLALTGPVKKKLIVVHLLGTHSSYRFRYPPSFAVFEDEPRIRREADLSGSQQSLYDAYDNAILYHDKIVSTLIKDFHDTDPYGALVYFADHGEEVFDHRDFRGRSERDPSTEMYTVPFLISLSDTMRARVKTDAHMSANPYSLESFMHTWCDLAAISYEQCKPNQSLINSQFTPGPRMIGEPGKSSTSQTYEAMALKQQQSSMAGAAE